MYSHITRFTFIVFFCLLGPFSALGQLSSWTSLNGPYGGTVVHDFVELQNGTLLAGTLGGVFHSQNGGESWSHAGTPLPDPHVTDMALAPNGQVWLTTAEKGIFRSVDDGLSWFGIALQDERLTALAINRTGWMYVATEDGRIFRSEDTGLTWQEVSNAMSPAIVNELAVSSNGVLVAATSVGLFRSSDAGATWSMTSVGFPDNNIQAVRYTSNNLFFAGSETGYLYRSDQTGANWTVSFMGSDSLLIHSLTEHTTGQILAGTVLGIMVFDALGKLQAFREFGFIITEALHVTQTGRILAGTYGGGIYTSENSGLTWTQRNEGLGSVVTSMVKTYDGALVVGTFGGGLFRTRNEGASWETINQGLISLSIQAVIEAPNGDLYAGSDFGHVFRSIDGGDFWLQTGFPQIGGRERNAVRGLLTMENGTILAGARGGIFALNPLGQWTPRPPFGQDIQVLISDGVGGLYASTPNRLLYSINQGTNWDPTAVLEEAYSIGADHNGNVFVAGLSGSLYRSRANQSLVPDFETIEGPPNVRSFAFTDRGLALVGTDGSGVYATGTRGDSWFPANQSLAASHILSLLTPSGSDEVYIGTRGHGVFRSEDITPVQTSTETSPIPSETALSAAWPNPFAETTQIAFTLSQPTNMRLSIYNILGQEVAILAEGHKDAGSFEVTFGANNLPTGLYIARLEAGNIVHAQTMTLVR